MSVLQMTLVFRQSKSKGAARLVLLAMADEASDEGELTAYRRSQSHLAKKCNLAVRSVQRAIDELVELGEVEVVKLGDGRISSDYQLNIEGRQVVTPAPTSGHPRGGSASPPSSPSLPVDPVEGSSLRSEPAADLVREAADDIARSYYDWHKEEAGGKPALAWPALIAVIKAALKREYVDTDILDALKSIKGKKQTTAMVIDEIKRAKKAREDQPVTGAIPGSVLRAFTATQRFLDDYAGRWDRHMLMEAVAGAVRQGTAVGSAMLRVAVQTYGADMPTTMSLRFMAAVPDGVESASENDMRAARQNGAWRV